MHEEVNRESIAFVFKAGRVTTHLLERAMQMYLQHRKASQGQEKDANPKPGKISMKELSDESGGNLSNIEITKRNIGDFDPIARKYRLQYSLKKAPNGRYYVFFKSNSADAMTAAFKEFTAKQTRKTSRKSLVGHLRKLVEQVKSMAPAKSKNKKKEQEL